MLQITKLSRAAANGLTFVKLKKKKEQSGGQFLPFLCVTFCKILSCHFESESDAKRTLVHVSRDFKDKINIKSKKKKKSPKERFLKYPSAGK